MATTSGKQIYLKFQEQTKEDHTHTNTNSVEKVRNKIHLLINVMDQPKQTFVAEYICCTQNYAHFIHTYESVQLPVFDVRMNLKAMLPFNIYEYNYVHVQFKLVGMSRTVLT